MVRRRQQNSSQKRQQRALYALLVGYGEVESSLFMMQRAYAQPRIA